MAQKRSSKALTENIRAPFMVGAGISNTPSTAGQIDNNYAVRAFSATQTGADIEIYRVDASDNLLINGSVSTPIRRVIKFNLATTASLVTQHFMIIPAACTLVGITEIHSTAEVTGTTMTAYVEKLTGTQAPGSGVTIMSGTFAMTGTANTLQTGTLTSTPANVQLAAGDRLGIVFSSAATELVGVVVTITLSPAGTGHWEVYNMQANGDLIDQNFFLANRDFVVTAAYEVHSTLGTNGSAVNVQITKDTGTNAPGAGTDLLTNSTNAGFNLKAAINTVQTATFATTAGLLRLAPGNRLAVDFAGTLTAVAGVVVVVVLQPVSGGRKDITFTLDKVTNLNEQGVLHSRPQLPDHGCFCGLGSVIRYGAERSTDAATPGPTFRAAARIFFPMIRELDFRSMVRQTPLS